MTLEELRENLTKNPPELATDMTKEEASAKALELFEGCEQEVIDTYLTGPKDADGIAYKRGDTLKIDDPENKHFQEHANITRIVRDGDNVTLVCNKKFQTTPENAVRVQDPDPVRDVVSKLAKILREDGPINDPTAP